MEKKTPNFLTYLFGVTPPIRCYPLLRYSPAAAVPANYNWRWVSLMGALRWLDQELKQRQVYCWGIDSISCMCYSDQL
jgi:hypothetical protein